MDILVLPYPVTRVPRRIPHYRQMVGGYQPSEAYQS
jgi:hypothetical protein